VIIVTRNNKAAVMMGERMGEGCTFEAFDRESVFADLQAPCLI
jgi:hypothetical protein